MPEFRITAPDGRRFTVNAPEGASPDEVAAYVRQQLGAPSPEVRQPARTAEPATTADSMMMGLGDPVHGGAQMLAHSLPSGIVRRVNDATAFVNRQPVIGPVTRALGMVPATPEGLDRQIAEREAGYQASREAAGDAGTDWGRMAGQFAASLPLARIPGAATLPGAIAGGAATGAAGAALMPVTEGEGYWREKGNQAATGAAFGAAGGAAGRALGSLIAPRASPQAQLLAREGVELTPGQALGGAARRIEDKGRSLLFVGDQIAGAQERALHSFNRAVANRVLEPLGQRVNRTAEVGRPLVDDVATRIEDTYASAIARARPFGPDPQFSQDVQTLAQQFLTPNSRRAFEAAVRDGVMSRFANGRITPDQYQRVYSMLGQNARRYSGSSVAAERELGEAFGELREAFRDLLARQNPHIAPQLQAANAAYARLVRMEGAAGSQAATNGVFTPQQFSAAVKSGDRSTRRRAYSRGDALMQDLADAGRAVLPSTVPDSGTAGRLLMAGQGAAALANPGLSAALTMPAVLAYTRPVANTITRTVLRQPGPVQQGIAQYVQRGLNTAAPGIAAAAYGSP